MCYIVAEYAEGKNFGEYAGRKRNTRNDEWRIKCRFGDCFPSLREHGAIRIPWRVSEHVSFTCWSFYEDFEKLSNSPGRLWILGVPLRFPRSGVHCWAYGRSHIGTMTFGYRFLHSYVYLGCKMQGFVSLDPTYLVSSPFNSFGARGRVFWILFSSRSFSGGTSWYRILFIIYYEYHCIGIHSFYMQNILKRIGTPAEKGM